MLGTISSLTHVLKKADAATSVSGSESLDTADLTDTLTNIDPEVLMQASFTTSSKLLPAAGITLLAPSAINVVLDAQSEDNI